MKNIVKVLKDGMTNAELRAADLSEVCDLERDLIEIILNEDNEDNTVINFEDAETVAIGCAGDEFYITYNEDAINTTIADAVELIESGSPAYWDTEWDDEVEYAKEIIDKFDLYMDTKEAVEDKNIIIFINEDDFIENTSNRDYNDYAFNGNEFGKCEYENEDYDFFFNREQNGYINYIALVKSELIEDAA